MKPSATEFPFCAIIAILCLATLVYPSWLTALGLAVPEFQMSIQFLLIAIPAVTAFVAVSGIGTWIRWTMATTPPPNLKK